MDNKPPATNLDLPSGIFRVYCDHLEPIWRLYIDPRILLRHSWSTREGVFAAIRKAVDDAERDVIQNTAPDECED